MSNQKKQNGLSVIGWINIILLTPVLFFTILYDAQISILQLRTEQGYRVWLMYVLHIGILLLLFLPAVIMQTKQNEKRKSQMSFLLALNSLCVLVYLGIKLLTGQSAWHIFGWVMPQFLQSYTGVALFCANIIFYVCMHKLSENKTSVNKWMYVASMLFIVLMTGLYFF